MSEFPYTSLRDVPRGTYEAKRFPLFDEYGRRTLFAAYPGPARVDLGASAPFRRVDPITLKPITIEEKSAVTTETKTKTITIQNPPLEKIKAGDVLTYRFSDAEHVGAMTATVYERNSVLLVAHMPLSSRFMRFEKLEREVQVLPTKAYALIVPKRGTARTSFLLNSTGRWLNDGGSQVDAELVASALTSGTHRLAFGGVSS